VTTLRAVERAAAKAAVLLATRDDMIRLAHDEGESLRAIAKAANLSHETVRRIVAQ